VTGHIICWFIVPLHTGSSSER